MNNKDTQYPALDGTSPWKLGAAETVEHLDSHSDEGLDPNQARSRLQKYGPNRIEAAKQRSAWQIFTAQIKNLIVLLLAAAAGVSFILGQFLEGIAIPEGLPIVATIALARGMWRMARKNAQLSEDGDGVGDPMELALLQAGKTLGLQRDALLESYPEKKEEAFSPETKMMATWHAGVRVVMVTGDHPGTASAIARKLNLPGDGKDAVHGDRLKPTEDYAPEERHELLKSYVFARISPKQKLNLVSLFQADGSVVAMTFLILAFTRTWHVFNMRDTGSGVIFNDVTRNPFVWGAVILSIVLLVFAVYFPPLSQVLTMVAPTPFQWVFILGMSLIPLVVVQILKKEHFFKRCT